MNPYPRYHDTSEKIFSSIFNAAYDDTPQIVPANNSPQDDLNIALDIIFNHPNVAPFISKALIQKLVTSNPSPAYVQRVAQIFNDNGYGVRGDLKAVIKAILLDQEAMNGYETDKQNFGKLREPLLRISHLWRAFKAEGILEYKEGVAYQNYNFEGTTTKWMLQSRPLNSQTVFNYFIPDFQPSGILRNNGLNAPEFQIMPALKIGDFSSFINNMLLNIDGDYKYSVSLDFEDQKSLLLIPEILIEQLNILLLNGQMSEALKRDLSDYVYNNLEGLDNEMLIRKVISLIVISAEYAIQR
jgi:hypothetical protein